jgi:dTDP-4-amino-4,6-dideoxygalactose transaminase
MPIHFGGDVCAGIRELRGLADEHDLLLFEDACHSIGATLDDDPVGSFGEAAMFSFCFNKILSTGEGGMVVTDSEEVRDELELLRSHGRNDEKEYVTYGHNFRMSSMTAALGVSQADKLDEIVGRRREMAGYLNDRLSGIEGIECPIFPDERDSVYQLYNLRVADPGEQSSLRSHLDERGIPTRVTYAPVHLTRYYQAEWGWEQGDLPVTEEMSNRIVTLPFHLDLSETDLGRIASSVRSFYE